MELKPHQQQAYRAIFSDLKQGHTKQLIVMPTGGGKTFVACRTAKRIGGRALFVVQTEELIQQTVQTLLTMFPASAIGILKGGMDEGHKRIVVATVQSLRNPKRLERLEKAFRVIVMDEAHHAPAESYRRILDYFADSQPIVIGLTATPWRLDKKSLDEIFPRTSVELTIKDGVKAKWLCKVVGKLVYLKDADFSRLHIERGDYKPEELEVVMRAANWDEYVAQAYMEHAGNRKTIVFVPTVAMAHQLAALLQSKGVLAEAADGRLSDAKRRDVVARLKSGKLDVVVNCALFTEGFDEPQISCVIMARPTASWGLYVQCVGRGLRPSKNKTCLVLDVVGATQRHSLVSFPKWAKKEGLPNGGRPGAPGEAEEIGALSAEQEAMWVDLLEEETANPACIWCGSARVLKNGTSKNKSQVCYCTECSRYFTLAANGLPSRLSLVRLLSSPPCVLCGHANAHKHGTLPNGSRMYVCPQCGRNFTLTSDGQLVKRSIALLGSKSNPPCIDCESRQTKKTGSRENGNRSYRCTDCNLNFTLTPEGRQVTKKASETNPGCMRCGSEQVRSRGRTKSGNRYYKCTGCNRNFTATPDGQQTAASLKMQIANPSCAWCGSERTTKNGKLKYGNQYYKCNKCKRHFTPTASHSSQPATGAAA